VRVAVCEGGRSVGEEGRLVLGNSTMKGGGNWDTVADGEAGVAVGDGTSAVIIIEVPLMERIQASHHAQQRVPRSTPRRQRSVE